MWVLLAMLSWMQIDFVANPYINLIIGFSTSRDKARKEVSVYLVKFYSERDFVLTSIEQKLKNEIKWGKKE